MDNTDTLTVQERKEMVEAILVKYPRTEEIMSKIEACHFDSKYTAEPKCLFVKGPSGAGKSTILRRYLEKHPRRTLPEGTVVPVLCAAIPVPATVNALVTRLLKGLGDPLSNKGTISAKTERLYELIEECKVELVMLDEFQNFIDSDSQKVLRTVADWLKNLLNHTKKPIILFGLPNSEDIFYGESQQQLSRRFPYRMYLTPFKWSTKDGRNEFRAFLKILDESLPLPASSHLADPDIAIRLYSASNGIVNYVMKIVRAATHKAIDKSLSSLSLDLLAEAFDEEIRHIFPSKPNVFRTTVKLAALSENTQPPSRKTASTKRQVSKRALPLNQILSSRKAM
jgi:GTPase SAR1 family protein